MIKVLAIFGTRPEAIKMAPVIRELERLRERVITRVCVTGQHRSMLDQVLEAFQIRPDCDLDLMKACQSPSQVAASILSRLEPILKSENPDWVLVQGDTTTTMAASLAASCAGIWVGHIEAGLRSFDKRQPFPEELNRRVVSATADLHFAPTLRARDNLLLEGIPPGRILVTGNTIVDALHIAGNLAGEPLPEAISRRVGGRRLLLVTAHRRENWGPPLESICEAIREVASCYESSVRVVWPVHLHPNVREPVHRILEHSRGIILTPPLGYVALVQVIKQSFLVLTDSGGLQEEAPSFGKPVLVLRNATERPEAVEAGTAKLVGTDPSRILHEVRLLLDHPDLYAAMASAVNPYGDGTAARRIVASLLECESTPPYVTETIRERVVAEC